MTKRKRERLVSRLAELKEDRALARAGLHKILSGEAQSYSLGTRSKSSYAMSVGELRHYIADIESEIEKIENQLDGYGARYASRFVPNDF